MFINHLCGQFGKTADRLTMADLVPKCVLDSIMAKTENEILNGSSTLDPFGVLKGNTRGWIKTGLVIPDELGYMVCWWDDYGER